MLLLVLMQLGLLAADHLKKTVLYSIMVTWLASYNLASGDIKINPPLVLPVLALALGVALPTMVRGDGADLRLRRWGFRHGWMGWLCGMHVRSSCDDRGGLIEVTRC